MINGTHQTVFDIIGNESSSVCRSDDICYYNNRETDCGFNTSSNTIQTCEKNDKLDVENREIKVNIYRYKFIDEFTSVLSVFAKIHQYDHRKDFKEAWNIWVEENNEIVTNEVNRLEAIGYQGDILDKMFKSARYYFRKKSTEKKEPKERQDYLGSNREFLNKIDEHIKTNINNDDYKPSNDFECFCKENIQLLQEEVTRLFNIGLKDHNAIKNKIKKTYKNRYFIIINNNQ